MAAWIVGILGVMGLALVGGIAYLEVRPILDARRGRLEHALDETTRTYSGPRRSEGDSSSHAARLLLGSVLVLIGYWEWSNCGFGGEWRIAEGTILDAHIESEPDGSQQRGVIWFSYNVGGRDFTSTWVDGKGDVLTHIDDEAKFVAAYPTGQRIPVWYHPMLPHFPSLGRVTLWYVVLALAMGAFLVVTSGLSLVAMRKWKTAAA